VTTWLDARLGRRGDRAVLLTCLAGIGLGIGLFLVLPLAPRLASMHQLPTNHDFDVEPRPQGLVTAFWLVSMASFAVAVWQWRRGRRLSLALLVAGAIALSLLAFWVPPVASKDVYAYSFYGKVQTAYGANPYLSFPDQYPMDTWHPFWSWRLTGPVYGPPFLLLLRLVAMVSGPSILAWVLWMKVLLIVAELGAVALLVHTLRRDGNGRDGDGRDPDPRWPILLIAWNPMVLQAIAMSAHVDALLLLLLAVALVAHRRGRHLLAFVVLVVLFLFKVYMGPIAVLYAIWLAAGKPSRRAWLGTIAGLGAIGAALTAIAYLPFASAGGRLFGSAVDVSTHYSSGSPPNLVRRLLAATLPLAGIDATTAAAAGERLGRQLATAAILVAFVLVARKLRAGEDPWPRIAGYFLLYLLLTPWVFYWHELPLLGIVAVVPWSLTSLGAVALSITLTPAVPAGPPIPGGTIPSAAVNLRDTFLAFLGRYGGAVAAVLIAWQVRRRRKPGAAERSAPERSLGGQSEASGAMRSGAPR
jgi:Glycosyltransferase family 87